MEDTNVLTDLLVQIIGSAPATMVLLYLIYRQERKEETIMQTVIEITQKCLDLRLREMAKPAQEDPPAR